MISGCGPVHACAPNTRNDAALLPAAQLATLAALGYAEPPIAARPNTGRITSDTEKMISVCGPVL